MREIEESIDNLRRTADEMSRDIELLTIAERMGGFGFIVRNLENDEIWLSEGVYKIFGLRRKSKLAQTELIATVAHPDDVDLVTEAVATAVAGGEFDMVHRVVHPDGEVRLIRSKGRRIEGDSLHPPSLLGSIVDITPVDKAKA
jgi:PAS domain-containing protein